MSEAKVTGKGRITIPVSIRKAMGLAAGHRVVFTRLEDGSTVLRAKTRSILDLKGLLKPASKGKRKARIADMSYGHRRRGRGDT